MEEILMSVNFSNLGWEIALPLILIVADILTGLIQSLINGDFNSSVMRRGLYHKALEILVIALGFMFQFAFNAPSISWGVVIYIVVMEIGSILENLKKAGLDLGPLGKILKLADKDTFQKIVDDISHDILDGENSQENSKK